MSTKTGKSKRAFSPIKIHIAARLSLVALGLVCLGGTGQAADRQPPVNRFGAPVVDAEGRGINYSREDLAKMKARTGALAPIVESRANAAPHGFVPATAASTAPFWQYAVFGSGIGLSNILIQPSAGGGREIIVGGDSATYYGSDDFWQVLRRNAATGNYDQIFVSATYSAGIKRLALGNVIGDSQPELVVMLADGRIYFYDAVSKAELGSINTGVNGLEGLSVTDLDGDGVAELIVTTLQDLFVFDGTGALLWQVAGAGGYEVVAGQMDNDSGLEIASTNGKVVDADTRTIQWGRRQGGFGFHLKLAPLPGAHYQQLIVAEEWNYVRAYDVVARTQRWSIPTPLNIAAIEVADVDNDGTPEVIIGDEQFGTVHVHDLLTQVQKWSVSNPQSGVTNIAVGDVDNDGAADLLWGAGYTSTGPDYLYVASATGTHTIKWQSVDLGGPFLGPVFGDLDGDGQPEMVVCSYDAKSSYDAGRILVFDPATMALRAMSPPVAGNHATDGIHDLKLRDMEGDGRMEILVATDYLYDGQIEIYGFNADNSFVLKWTNTQRPGSAFNFVDVADLDGNGTPEIIAGTTRVFGGSPGVFVYVYDYPSGVNPWHFTLTEGSSGITGLVVDNLDGVGGKEIAALASTGDLYTFNGQARVLESIMPQAGALITRRSPLGLIRGDSAGVGHFLQYAHKTYSESFSRQLGTPPLDGVNMLSNGHVWTGTGGTLGLRVPPSYDGMVWQSPFVGSGFGRVVATDYRNGQNRVFSSAGHEVAGFTYEVPLPSPTPTGTPVPSPTPNPSPTSSPSPSATPTPGVTPTPPVPTPTPTPTPTPLLINPNNILVSIGTPIEGQGNNFSSVREFTPAGTLVQTIPFNYDNTGYPATEYLRDITVDQPGSIAAYNGTFTPLMTRCATQSRTFTHTSLFGWSTVNSIYYSGIAAYQGFVYVTDMSTANDGMPNGVIRFDPSNHTSTRFAGGISPTSLSMGLDGNLYVVPGINVYDPVTMVLLRQVHLPTGVIDAVRSVAVDQMGRIFVCGDSMVYRLSSSGVLEASKSTGFSDLRDIAIDETGRLIVAQGGGRVLVGDTTLTNNFTSFLAINNPNVTRWTIYLAFARPIPALAPAPADIVSITSAVYTNGNHLLHVQAADSIKSIARGAPILRVAAASTGEPIGNLASNSDGTYGGDLAWPGNPDVITVTSSLGGHADMPVLVGP